MKHYRTALRVSLIACIVSMSCMAKAQTADTAFKKQWIEIDTLIIQKDLTRTAINKVKSLYAAARQRQSYPHVIRSLVYLNSLEDRITENEPNRITRSLKNEIAVTKDPTAKAILHSLLAKQYKQYYFNHRWNLQNRKKTDEHVKDDIALWSSDDFTNAIITHYRASISNPALLQKQDIETYQALLINGNSRKLRPTLYDLLVHEALDYFKAANNYTSNPVEAFILNDTNALAAASVFNRTRFITKDSASAKWISLQLFQSLLAFHANDTNKDPLVTLDLERIEWVTQQGIFTNEAALYRTALENIIRQYPDVPASVRAWYLLAKIESDKAAGYQPFGDTSNRFGYVTAERIIQEALSKYRSIKTDLSDLNNLLSSIYTKQLNTQTEQVNVPGKPFRALISYRNTDTLFARIIRLDDKSFIRENMYREDYWKKVTALPSHKSFIQVLPLNTDHQLHSAEIKIDALPVGEYALLTSSGNRFTSETDKLTLQVFYVSNISYVRKDKDLFVLNRETGNPLNNVKVIVTKPAQGKTKETKTEFSTDKNGYLRLNLTNDSRNYRFQFSSGNDRLAIPQLQYYYDNSNGDDETEDADYEEDNARVFFFTDRSIYRPEQTVFFKGIAITKDPKTKLSKLITKKVDGWVYLKNTHGEEIDSAKFTLNEYGSFSGSFKLPANELTGEFTISTDEYNNNEVRFSVEEYKRPRFAVSFDKVKGSYRLNDSIRITGNTQAFAGNAVSGAKVTYRVVRNTRFRTYDWRRPIPNYPQREIAQGELTTDANGRFIIRFKAAADDILDRMGDPFFDFQVEADVTDINGETHSSSAVVTAAFSALKLQVTVPAITEVDSLKHIRIHTTNYSDEKEPALVQVKISPLEPQQRLIRKRYWQRPDQFVMTEKEYIGFFPTDEYANETDMSSWKTGTPVIERSLNTADTNLFMIPAGQLKAGYYKIETSTKDTYGAEVKQVSYVQLFDRRNGKLPIPAYQFTYKIKNQVLPGDEAVFLSGSAANNIFVISQVSRPQQKENAYTFEYHTNGIRTIRYTPTETDRGNVSVTELYVIDNRVYTATHQVIVPWSNKVLQVSYASYRNKTEPGSKETWSIAVSGFNGEKVAAELLTTMYDASLDQFREHQWQVPSLWDIGYVNNDFDYSTNFTTAHSSENYPRQYYAPGNITTFDRLPNNGQEVWNQSLEKWIRDSTIRLNIFMRAAMEELQDVMVTGYGTAKRKQFTAALANQSLSSRAAGVEVSADNKIKIRGIGSADGANAPIYIVDGQIVSGIDNLDPSMIGSVNVIKGEEAVALYGSQAINGAVIISTGKVDAVAPVQIRKNFNETAFFFPQLYADSTGKFSFSFTMPEALTKWKWMALAHTKELAFGDNSTTIVTQKKLMVQPNAPRFVREGDNMELSTKIVNLTDKEIKGQATLELIDLATNTPVDGWFQNVFPMQYFTAEAGQSIALKFPVQIPFSYNKPLTWRIVARSENMSDGEENTLPVLTNRMLVTETLPIFLPKDTTMQFVFNKLLNNKSESLTHESITVEYTSNPVWYAVQALPYLIDFPYECAEQTFNRFYTNTLASYIINKHPRIKQVFEQWQRDTTALLSNLQKNEELKQILLQETPWVLQAETEEQKKKNLVLLFDLARLSTQSDAFINKLENMQLPDGSFSWFPGGHADRYITNYILTGIGKLKRLGALTPDLALRIRPLLTKAMQYVDGKIAEEYNNLVKTKTDLSQQHIYPGQIDYLYMRSFFSDMAQSAKQAYDYYYKQGKQFWTKQNSYYKAQLGLIYFRNKEEQFARNNILPALLENTVEDSKLGMYWKASYTGYWYQSPIEHQSMMIAFVSEIGEDGKGVSLTKEINAMKTWLLLNKQTNNWRTTIATADACYALLLNGSDWLNNEKTVTIRLGNVTTASNNTNTEAGTGYFKKRIDGKTVNNEMGNISVSVNTNNNFPISQSPNSKISQSPSWGSVYWQYFEDLDKITPAASPLSLVKKLFIERNTDKGKLLQEVKENEELKIGDKVIVRLELRSDRDMDYLHLKDMRAASMEPVNVLSGYKWQDRLGYYESTRDASTSFFIDHLSKGTYVFEYPLFITHAGVFSVGIANIQCMYAPEFTSHSAGIKIRVINP